MAYSPDLSLSAREELRPQRGERPSEAMSPAPTTPELVKSVEQLRSENLELRHSLLREADELAGENERLRTFLGANWQ